MSEASDGRPETYALEFTSHEMGQHLEGLELIKTTIQLVKLSNGRTLAIEEYGVFDLGDVDSLERIGNGLKGFVSWPELLEVLDRVRAGVSN